MKIVTTGPHSAAVAKPRAAGGGGAAGGAGFAPRTGGERPAPAGGGGVAPGAPLTALGALLAAQEVPEVGGGGRRRAARRGHDLLDRLDELRLALLEGGVPEPTLRRLVALLEERAGPVDDPRLGAVLHEIEVRAAVELAKLERG